MVPTEAFVQCPNCGAPIKIGATSRDGCSAGKKWDEMPAIETSSSGVSVLTVLAFAAFELTIIVIRDRLKSSLSPDSFITASLLLIVGEAIFVVLAVFLFSKYRAWKKRPRSRARFGLGPQGYRYASTQRPAGRSEACERPFAPYWRRVGGCGSRRLAG